MTRQGNDGWEGFADVIALFLVLYLFLGWIPALMCWAVASVDNSPATGYVGDALMLVWGLFFIGIMISVGHDE